MNGIVFLLLFSAITQAMQFPDTLDLKAGRKVAERSRGLPVKLLPDADKDAPTVLVTWGEKGMEQVEYLRESMFSDGLFSEIAGNFSQGATWHEIPLLGNEKEKLRSLFPGLEQQWVLKGYGGISGWMGSGIREEQYYLVFSSLPPVQRKVVADPLDFKTNIGNYFKTSSFWVPSKCGSSSTLGRCFISLNNSLFQAETDSGGTGQLKIYYRENKPIEDIRNVIISLPPHARRDYARELSALARFESQNVLVKLAQLAPDLFNWPSWQFQDMAEGRISAKEFEAELNKRDGKWPSIPIFYYKGKKLDIDIFLFFNGHYLFHVKEK